ncbi:septal ring lytic transglycosylase RlpA family protein [Niveispirillum sp. KHB5.9]|uniref:septal ring lytic transglycosylase RlpA family protein n=1 Tax=Niveispirillum sp. KHB5.9 TaxID=3400269 RepID=UPI003A870CA8
MAVLGFSIAGLAGCSSPPPPKQAAAPAPAPVQPQATPGGSYKVGNPYQIDGVWYYPRVDYGYNETGIASWYGPGFHAKVTANGEDYNEMELTAAHQTLPMPSLVRVTNLENGKSIVVRINDRGPFVSGRIIDMSRKGAQLLGFDQQGTAKVRVEVLAEESRAIAAAAMNAGMQVSGLSPDGGPLPQAAPRPSVTVESTPLAPPAGTKAAPGSAIPPKQPQATPAPSRTIAAPTSLAGTTTEDGRFMPAPVVQQQALPAKPGKIYIQAGAFANYDNANRLRAKLNSIAPTNLSNAMVNGQQYFRVRVGPFDQVERADQVLAQVLQAGTSEARIIVD